MSVVVVFGIIFTTMVFLVIYKNVKSLVIVIENDSGSNHSGIFIKR